MAERIPFGIWWHVFVEHRLESLGHRSLLLRPLAWLGRALYLTRRTLQGARPVRCGSYESTGGRADGVGVDVSFGGACPVQGDGEIFGFPCYYRARGEGWSLEVYAQDADMSGGLPEPIWEYAESPYFFPDGGWIVAEVSRENILRAARAFTGSAKLAELAKEVANV